MAPALATTSSGHTHAPCLCTTRLSHCKLEDTFQMAAPAHLLPETASLSFPPGLRRKGAVATAICSVSSDRTVRLVPGEEEPVGLEPGVVSWAPESESLKPPTCTDQQSRCPGTAALRLTVHSDAPMKGTKMLELYQDCAGTHDERCRLVLLLLY